MIDDADLNVEIYPLWRRALVHFREAGFTYGDTLPHTWLYKEFECEALADNTKISGNQQDKLKLKLLHQFQSFREALLEQEQIDLQSVPGVGYELVTPADQTVRALKDTMRDIERVWRNGMARAANVNTAALTTEQRRERIDTLARLALLGRQIKPPRELPPADD